METSINKAMLKPLENLLKCGICSNFFNNCVITACSHNFCSACMQERITTEADCPHCFEVIQKSDLRNNKVMDKMVRFYKKISSRLQSDVDAFEVMLDEPISQFARNSSTAVTPHSSTTVDATPRREKTLSAPHIHSFQASLTDITTPIKLEIIDCNESEAAEINTALNSNSFGHFGAIELESMQQCVKSCAEANERIESKLNMVLSTLGVDVSKQNVVVQDLTLISSLPVGPKRFRKLEAEVSRSPDFRKKLMGCLLMCDGRSYRHFMHGVLRKLMKDECAMTYSLTGKSNNHLLVKQSFQMTAIYRVLMELSCQHFPGSKTRELRELISNWLIQAEFRLRKRKERKEKREQTSTNAGDAETIEVPDESS